MIARGRSYSMCKNKTLRRIFGLEKEDGRRTNKIEWTCSTLDGNERNIKALKPKRKVTT
jgi:hypothetical protein